MSMQHIISQCADQGIQLALEQDNIQLTGNKSALTPALLELIRANKAELVQYIRTFTPQPPTRAAAAIRHVSRDQPLALSPAQLRIWLANEIHGQSAEYNMPGACQIEGPFDLDAASLALNEVVRRHEILRTCYRQQHGEPVQVVRQDVQLQISQHDLSALSGAAQDAALAQLLKAEINQPFDLQHDLMLRAGYIALEKGAAPRGVLLFNTHHIAFDGWSMAILHKEFFILYQAFSANQPSPLEELPLQYADYAAWQLARQQTPQLQQQWQYWQQQLDQLPLLHSLPTTPERPAERQFAGAVQNSDLSPATVAGLQQLARQHKLTPFMLLHSALALVLSRHSGQADIVLGTPVAGRLDSALEPLIGFFVNTLVLRANTRQPDLGAYFGHIRQVNIDAQSNQDLPFSQLVEGLKLPRDPSYNPLFQVMLTVDNDFSTTQQPASLHIGGSRLTVLAPDEVDVKSLFDLDFHISLKPAGGQVKLVYDRALFSQDTISALQQSLCQLLDRLATLAGEPAQHVPLTALQTLSADDIRQRLAPLQGKAVPRLNADNVHQLFEQQALQTPDHCAVRAGGEALSYAALNQQANQLAGWLRARQPIEPDTLIGVCMGRSCALVVTILAILKAGAAYVPLDPDYPSARLHDMVSDAGLSLILTDPAHQQHPAFAGCQTVAVQPLVLDAFSTDNLAHPVSARQLAYVIFTSGSTGKPKGIMVEHRNLLHFLLNIADRYQLTPADRVLQFSTMNFDIFVEELFGALCHGATLVLRDDQCLEGTAAFNRFCSEHHISVVSLPTAFWLQLNSGPDKIASPALRLIILGGEALQAEAVRAYFSQVQGITLVNSYGPTETTVTATGYHLNAAPQCNQIPIGTANVNTQLLILDDQLQPVPAGVTGELYIAGEGVARGYLAQPALTAQRFLANPYNDPAQSQRGASMYRSGDLVRLNSAGQLEFLGRLDDQVKIRGFRIELADIEQKLSALDGVASALVLAKEAQHGQKQLVAYLQSAGDDEVSAMQLRLWKQQLAAQLPDYMVPAVLVAVQRWPLTPNGKIDKRALPAPDFTGCQEDYVAPQTPTETALTAIWSQVLGLAADRLSVDANFFDLGGHSLLAVKLLTLVRSELRSEVSMAQIFSAPSIRQLAALLDQTSSQPLRSPVTAQAIGADGAPLSFAQQRLWFIDQLHQGSAEYNMPVAFRFDGALNIAAVEQALDRIVQRHQVLRSNYRETPDGVRQFVRHDVQLRLTRHDLSALSEQDQAQQLQQLLALDRQQSFDLSQDLMVRASVILLREAQQHSPACGVLLFNMHHIASDGWSMAVLTREFMAHYQAVLQQQDTPLPPLAVQYADYAQWQRQWLQGDVLQQQLDYWTRQLADLPAVHGLTPDLPRPAVKQYAGGRLSSQLAAPVSAGLAALARQHQLTPFMLLHGALALVLSRHSNSHDIVVGTPIANRLQAELTPLIGFFVNTLVLRLNTDQPDLASYLAQVRQVHLDAQSQQDLPFEQLVERLNVPRSTAHTPLFQIMLTTDSVYQTRPASQANQQAASEFRLDGVTLTALDDAEPVAKFDLKIQLDLQPDGVQISWVYDKALFRSERIERLNAHLQRCLTALAAIGNSVIGSPVTGNPVTGNAAENTPPASAIALSSLPLLSAQEQHNLLWQHNNRWVDYQPEVCLQQDFAAIAAATPQRIALYCGAEQLSYGELNARANQLAHHLVTQCAVKPGMLVGLCTERSVEMVAGILAILKAGAAYVPLDPAYPLERLRYIMQDAGLSTVLRPSHLHGLFAGTTLQQVGFDALSGQPVTDLPLLFDGDPAQQPAYVIYTSGSTGRPKGVCQSHGTLKSFKVEFAEQLELLQDPIDAPWLWLSSFAFDASLKGLVCLASGKPVVVATAADMGDLQQLAGLVVRHGVQVLNAVPHLLELVVDALGDHPVQLISSGDDIAPATLAKLLRYTRKHGTRLLNAYGPTETGVNSAFALIGDNLMIGKACRNTSLLVLDAQQRLLPPGAVGELYIGGVGLALGYLNAPALTAERFVPNPYHDPARPGSSARLYRSGDLVRQLDDGNLVFVGRADNQLKIRGLRIEPGEIETELCSLPAVDGALVLCHARPGQMARLIAFVRLKTAETASPANLTQALAARLPAYMVPEVQLIDHWPLTPTGKLDRRALLEQLSAQAEGSFHAPESATELQLQQIWAQLLDLPAATLSTSADFFGLGGHSLLAVQLATRIRQTFAVDLPLSAWFQTTTLASQAARISAAASAGTSDTETAQTGTTGTAASGTAPASAQPIPAAIGAAIPAIRPQQSDQGLYPLSSAQQRLWTIDALQQGSPEYNITLALQVDGDIRLDAANTALQQIVRRHQILRTVYVRTEQGPRQQVQDAPVLTIRHQDLSALPPERRQAAVQQLLNTESVTPFDLAQDLMIRCSYLQTAGAEGVLIFSFHHIAMDGWSMAIFRQEFFRLYQAAVHGEPDGLPALALQYRDYACWQQDWLQSPARHSQLAYWQQQLSGMPLEHQLPLRQPRPARPSKSAASVSGALDVASGEGLLRLARQHQMTPFMLAHAALALALSRCSQSDDIVIGTPVAGRTQAGLEPLLGFFVNTLVLRCQTGFATLDAYLAHIRSVNLAALGQQELPFDTLVDALKVPRKTAVTPLFQIMLTVHQNADSTTTDALAAQTGLQLTPLSADTASCKFDLDVSIRLAGAQSEVALVYDSALFEPGLMQQLCQQLCQLLNGMAALAAQQTAAIPLQQLGPPVAGQQSPQQPAQHRQLQQSAVQPPRLLLAEIHTDYQPASTALQQQLVAIWTEVLALAATPALSCQANFFESGGNSLLALLLASRIQQQLAVPFPAAQVFACQTIAAQAAAIEALQRSPAALVAEQSGTLTRLQQGQAGMPVLFLLHPVGGQLFCYRHLLQALKPQLPVFGLQCDGRRWPDLTTMASDYLALARQAAPGQPICLVGWSMGGVIAHEMQRLAATQGDETIQVVMIDAYPSQPATATASAQNNGLALIASMAAELGIRLPDNAQQLGAGMTEQQALQRFSELAAEQHPQFAGLSLAHWQHQLAVLKHNHQLLRRHPMQQSARPCLLIAAANHAKTALWSSYCEALTLLRMPDSDHFSIVGPALSPAIAAAVEQSLQLSENNLINSIN